VSTTTGQATIAAPPPVLDRVVGVPAHVAVGDETRLSQRVGTTDLAVSAASFFQSGPEAAELLVATVRSALDASGLGSTRPGVLVDAYGGVGLFAATLGWSHTIVIEASRSACDDARQTLGAAATVVCSTFEAWDSSTAPDEIGAVIADPARVGLGAAGVAAVANTGSRVVVLVSCDPVAMARDVAGLVAAGFVHREAVVLDLFPQTHHVEVVTLLER
jgi:23S rRNA (uracil1939-C5)-methyltransferase